MRLFKGFGWVLLLVSCVSTEPMPAPSPIPSVSAVFSSTPASSPSPTIMPTLNPPPSTPSPNTPTSTLMPDPVTHAFSANGITITPFAGSNIDGHKDGLALEAQFGTAIGNLCQDSQGNLYIPDRTYLRKLSPDGVVTTVAGAQEKGVQNGDPKEARFRNISACVVDHADNLYLTDATNTCIRKWDHNGPIFTFSGHCGQFGEVDGPPSVALFQSVRDLVIDEKTGYLIVIEAGSILLRQIELASGDAQTLYNRRNALGQDTTGFEEGSLDNKYLFGSTLSGIALDPSTSIFYVGDFYDNRGIRQIQDHYVTTLAGQANYPTRHPRYADGDGKKADFSRANNLAFEPSRKLIFVPDNSSIRTVTLDGKVRTLNLPGQREATNLILGSVNSVYVQDAKTLIVTDHNNSSKGSARFYKITLPDGPLPEILTDSPY
jgi:hypothetical protein